MVDKETTARRYLTPPPMWFWQWSDSGEVIAWSGGTTIAFRGELTRVLERLAPRGLPPLDAVVLVLAACRGTWPEASSELTGLVGALASAGRRAFPKWLSGVLAGLDAVAGIPAELRAGVEAEAVVVELVLEDSHYHTTPDEAEAILSALRRTTETYAVHGGRTWWQWQDLLRDLRIVERGLPQLDAETLELRLRTGLDGLVRPADLNLEPSERARLLISQLQQDRELGGLTRIARQLMAAVHLPRAIVDHEDLPVGGISDIANRGPLERLLVSELAQDGLTLAVRVAMNEALYWRRESPPRNPPRHRTVLVDAGIRMWGIPRVFATAAALALTAGGGPDVRVDVYRAKDAEVVPVDLTRREGLIKHLAALEPNAHPGDALPALVQADAPSDVVVVTGEDVAADPEFVRAISSLEIPSLFLATVDRSGRFRMVARGGRSSKVIREATLHLDELLALPKSGRPATLRDRRMPDALPAVFSATRFPLLLPHRIDVQRTWPVWGWGALAITHDGRLMHWATSGRGARQVSDQVSVRGPILWHSAAALRGTLALAVVGDHCRTQAHLLSVEWETDEVRAVPLELCDEPLMGFCDRDDRLFAIYGDTKGWVTNIDVLPLYTGRRMPGGSVPGHSVWYKAPGRIFHSPDGWFVLDWDGLQIRWERPIDAQVASRLHLIDLFERIGHAGFFGFSVEGRLYNESEGTWTDLMPDRPGAHWLSLAAPDGETLLVSERTEPPTYWHVDVATRRRERIFPGKKSWAVMLRERALRSLVDWRSLPRRLREIGRDSDGLVLVSRRATFRVELDAAQGRIRMRQISSGEPLGLRRTFEPAPGPHGARYELSVARWEDGSRAWLDSRGLLHLQSSDSSVPEATLVLDPACVSGWASDGRYWGSSYYVGEKRRSPAPVIFQEILEPFASRLL